MRAVIAWELRERRFAILWWTVAAVGLAVLLMALYPSIHDEAKQLNNVLNQLPDSLKALKTGGTNVDITSPAGYLHSQLFYITLPLVLIILSITRGSGLIGKEEQAHTLELLLARPISRAQLLLAKAISGTIEVLLVGATATIATAVLARVVGMDISVRTILITGLYTTLFSLSFGMISFTLTALGRLTKRASTTIATVVAFGGYILASLSGLSHYIETPARFVPYHYFFPLDILQGKVASGLLVYLAGVTLAAVTVSWFGFRRRDIS